MIPYTTLGTLPNRLEIPEEQFSSVFFVMTSCNGFPPTIMMKSVDLPDKAPHMDLETDSQRQSDQIIEEPSKKEIEYPNAVVSVENEKKQIPVVNPYTFSRHVFRTGPSRI